MTEGESFRLALVGDVMLGRLVNDVLKKEPPGYPWGDTLPLVAQADGRICNLECVISDKGEPWLPFEKAFHFRSAAKNVGVLEAARINAVSLANNHALDYGGEALEEMLQILGRSGIASAGAGRNLAEASKVAVTAVAGRNLGLVAFTDNEPDWEAFSSRAGVFYVPVQPSDARAKKLLEIVSAHKDAVDFLIVSAHWGSNWGYDPPREHVAFAHALVEAGADLVFGHSSHVFRGIEFYLGRPILYGAGNFVDDYAVDATERNDEGFVYLAEIEGRAARRWCLYPTRIVEFQARRATGRQGRSIADKMRKLCRDLGSEAEWNEQENALVVQLPTAR